jgi:transposase-like protein
VKGRWCYSYRAIDRVGNLVDTMLSETRDMDAAKRFFRQAVAVVGRRPARVTTDGHDAYPRAIRETVGTKVRHRHSAYLNTRLEQYHRGIKQRSTHAGFRERLSRFCRAYEELRHQFQCRRRMGQRVRLEDQRRLHFARLVELQLLMIVA